MDFRFKKRLFLFLIAAGFLCSFDAVVTRANNGSDIFPLPEELKPNVEFWKKIYGVYTKNYVIIHDAEHLDIIYEVVNLDSLFRGVNVSDRIKWKKVERISKEYKNILLQLAKKRHLDIGKLQGKEKKVALLFKDRLTPGELRAAARRIREQSGIKDEFERGLQRSGLYISQIREVFRREGLPLELAALPHVESSFNYRAYSKFGAAGIWQFTRSTGRRFMRINYSVDERFDPIRATESAAKLLKKNYEALGSWPLAITAYNHGRTGMKRAQKKYGHDLVKIIKHYKSRSFGFASRNFYAEFLAALEVSQHYKKYFGDIELYRPKDYVVFQTPDYITVKTLLSKLNIDLETFAEFNPALRKPVLQSRRRIPKRFRIRIPYDDGLNIEEVYARISSQYKYDEQINPEWHTVRRGENLSQIARRYSVSIRELMDLNDIRNAHRIYAGQNLQIPSLQKPVLAGRAKFSPRVSDTRLAEAPDLSKNRDTVLDTPPVVARENNGPESRPTKAPPENVAYIPAKTHLAKTSPDVQKRRSLQAVEVAKIENNYESVENVLAMALPDYQVQITRNMGWRVVKAPVVENIQPVYREIAFPQNGQIVVEPDETLGHIADWLNVPTQRIRRINGFSFRQSIHIGQPIWLTFENVTPEEFHRRRVEYHQGIEEDFYRSYTVTGQRIHKIRRGENIWYLCNNVYEIPYWLLKKYNPDKPLLQLVAGEDIVVPVVEEAAP